MMIARLRGVLVHKSPESSVIEAGGVGYQVFTPYSTYFELPEEGREVTLHIHTHVREDALQLFGFLTTAEREVFQLLINVSGIGPKLGINILSGINSEELKASVLGGDLVRLTAIPGVGKKTAERMVLELRDKVMKIHKEGAVPARPAAVSGEFVEDAISALVNLGYKRQQAESAINKVRGSQPGSGIEDMIKGALNILAR